MTEREFYDIVEGYEHVVSTDYPIFYHFYIGGGRKLNQKATETRNRVFKSREQLIDFFDEEYRKGNTVYYYGPPYTLYNPHDFSPCISLRIGLGDGIMGRKSDEPEIKIETNKNNYYLLIK